jgi:peptidoglycan/LPS O-acetylase OafA/YrhL
MQEVLSVELTVYLITALCAMLLLPKSSNWRFRLLIGTIGLQSLAHAASELRKHHPFWQSRLGHMTGVIEMFGGALALTVIYLLKHENRDRRSTDARLRLSEAVQPPYARGANSKPPDAGTNPMPGKEPPALE